MARKHFNAAELQRGSSALHYSIEMLRGCAWLRKENKYPNVLIEKTTLEAFLLHTRELLEFFYPPKRASNDTVLAKDFFDAPKTWTAPKITSTLKDAQTRLSRLLAHLSYSRDTLQREWNDAGIYSDLEIVLTKFITDVDHKKLIPTFDDLFPTVDGRLLPSASTTTSGLATKVLRIG